MHEPEIQNWLNHARSIGYTDSEIRGLMLKAGWSSKQVNETMTARGLSAGTASGNRTGKVVPRRLEQHGKAVARHYLTVGLLIAVSVVVWVVVYWAWQR
ncbi:MAG: hypothetical protein AAB515_01980 [Patescibacteria group bacterium]